MSPLRNKMIRELELHRKSPKTIQAYVTAVVQLAQYFDRSPDAISVEESRDFLHHLITDVLLMTAYGGGLRVSELVHLQPKDIPSDRKHLARCRELLGVQMPVTQDEAAPHSAADWMRIVLGIDITLCPCCGEPLRRERLRPSGRPAKPQKIAPKTDHLSCWDTS